MFMSTDIIRRSAVATINDMLTSIPFKLLMRKGKRSIKGIRTITD